MHFVTTFSRDGSQFSSQDYSIFKADSSLPTSYMDEKLLGILKRFYEYHCFDKILDRGWFFGLRHD